MFKPKQILSLFFYSFLFTACASSVSEQKKAEKAANPAALRCIEDGYKIKEIKMESGVIPELFCVNLTNQKQCKLWPYYRGQCTLK